MANSCSYLQLYPTSGAWIEIMHKSGKKGKHMELQELGLSDIQMKAYGNHLKRARRLLREEK